MRKLESIFLYVILLVSIGTIQLIAQTGPNSKIVFLDAPVLFKEGNKSFHQVVATYTTTKKREISFSQNGKELINKDLDKFENRIPLTFPFVTRPSIITILVKIDNRKPEKYAVTLVPPKKWQIYFVQHSLTEIGYKRPQSGILAEHMHYIDYALEYCDQTDDLPADAKFRWTCESAWVTREFLRSRPGSESERFIKRIAEDCIEVMGMYANMAKISDGKDYLIFKTHFDVGFAILCAKVIKLYVDEFIPGPLSPSQNLCQKNQKEFFFASKPCLGNQFCQVARL